MASRRKGWANLSASQRQRYIRWGRRQGWSEDRTERYYETGGNLRAAAGHAPKQHGTEYQWRELRRLAKQSRLAETANERDDILEALLEQGNSYEYIRDELIEQRRLRDQYSIGRSSREARRRYHANKNDPTKAIELFWYH